MPGYPTVFPVSCCEERCKYTWVGTLVLDCKADESDVATEQCIAVVCDIPQTYIDTYIEGIARCEPCSGIGSTYVRLAFEGSPTSRPEGCYWLYLAKAPSVGGDCDDCPPPSCPSCCPDYLNTPFWSSWGVWDWACSQWDPDGEADLNDLEVIPWNDAVGSLQYTYYQYAEECKAYNVCEFNTVPEGGTCSYCTLQDDDDDDDGGGGPGDPPGPTDKPCDRIFGTSFKMSYYISQHASWGQEDVSHQCIRRSFSDPDNYCEKDCFGADNVFNSYGCGNVQNCQRCQRPGRYAFGQTETFGQTRSCINYTCAGRGTTAAFTEPARWEGVKKTHSCCNHSIGPDRQGNPGQVFSIAPNRSVAVNYDLNLSLPIYECEAKDGVYRALYRKPDDAPWDDCPFPEIERVDVVGYSDGVPYPQNTQPAPVFDNLPCNDGYLNGDLQCDSSFLDEGGPLNYLFASSRCMVNYPMLEGKKSWKGRWMAEVLFNPVTGLTEMEVIFEIDQNATNAAGTLNWCRGFSYDDCCRVTNISWLQRDSFVGPIYGPNFGRVRFASTERDPETNLFVRPKQLNHFFNPWANPVHPYKADLALLKESGHCPPATSHSWRLQEYLPCIEKPQEGCDNPSEESICNSNMENLEGIPSGPFHGGYTFRSFTCEGMYGDYTYLGNNDDCPLWGGLFGPQQMNDPSCDRGSERCVNGFETYAVSEILANGGPDSAENIPGGAAVAVEDFVVNDTTVIPCPRNEWARSVEFMPGTGDQIDPNAYAKVCNGYGIQEGFIYRLTYSAPPPGEGHNSSASGTPVTVGP